MHRSALLVALVGALALACPSEPAREPAAQAASAAAGGPPAIVLVVVDALRADHLSLYGHERPTSPRLDALAARSTVYARAYAQAPWTGASVASLLSSRYPSEIGVGAPGSSVPQDVTLLPERLRSAGYATRAIVSHELLASQRGFARGFERFDERFVEGPRAVTSEGISDLAVRWIGEQAGEPFFLFLHYADPRPAYVAHAGFDFREAAYAGAVRSGTILPDSVTRAASFAPSEADLDQLRRIYDSEIAWTDHHIGRVLDALREHGLLGDALIVVTADHGEAFRDHGLLGHGRTLYDELVRVPLVVHYPGAAAARVDTAVALVDVHPTILDVVGLRRGPALRGRSLRGVTSESRSWPIFLETTFAEGLGDERRIRELRAVVFGRHKLIAEAGDARHPSRAELYDTVADPGETAPLGDDHPAMERLAPMLQRWIEANVPRDAHGG